MISPKPEDASAEKHAIADGGTGLRFWHTYIVSDIDTTGKRVRLFNPWGNTHPNGDGWVSVDIVHKFFVSCEIND